MIKALGTYLLGFFISLANIIIGSVTGLTYYLFNNKWRATSFIGIVIFILGYIIVPDWLGFWAIKNKVMNVASREGHVFLICHNFRDFSEEQKEKLGFKTKLLSAQHDWWEANNDLFLTISDSYNAGMLGREIHTSIDDFRKLNLSLSEYVETHNACPENMPSEDAIGNMIEKILNMLPLTVGEYIKFYIQVRLLGG